MNNRVLVLDIETSPLEVYVWQLKDQYIDVSQLKKDWHIMAWAAKWLNDPANSTVYYDLRHTKNGDDKAILKPLWKLLNEADIVLTQNGKEFDSKKINARFMLHGMTPPKPYEHMDTYKVVKKLAAFTSNKLEYLTDKFCTKYKKLSHKKFPGLSLWIECLNGNKEAWDEMKKYNIHDVLSVEEFYNKIKAWAASVGPQIYTASASSCGTCDYRGKMVEGKPRRAKKYSYRQHSCPNCGSWQIAERIK